MRNFENTMKRRFKIEDFNVEENKDIYINDILYEPVEADRYTPKGLYDMFFSGVSIQVNYYCPTDGRNFPKRFLISYIEKFHFVEFVRI